MGTYWTADYHIIGNTQQLAAFIDVKDLSDPGVKKKQYDLGYQIGSFVSSVRSDLAKSFGDLAVARSTTAITITNYYDINTNKHNVLFVDCALKEQNLFYLHLLCNMNFVKYILRPLFPDGNAWVFRIEYIVTYYTFRALLRLKSYCENNHDIVVDTDGIKELELVGSNMFQSKLRNCMMHYNLENQNVLSLKYIERPFFGIIENCFDGMDYHSYLESLHSLSDRIIVFLEKHFNFSDIELKKF